jgi:serpin B
MKWKTIISILIILIISLSGCINGTVILADDSEATSEGIAKVVNANNQFTFDLYSNIKDNESNVFFSPYSISVALAMTYEGARGQTAEEIQSVFYFPEDDIIRRSSFARIYNNINKIGKEFELHTANALWAQEDYPFLEEYTSLIDQYYVGKITNLDFVADTENSRMIINRWVEEQTKNKIKDLIPQGAINSITRLVLTNAIYFKGIWVKQFDRRDTKQQDFKVSPDKTIKVPMMSLTEEEFNYTETEDLQVLEMPYKGEELSMLILLPKNDLESIEDFLNAEKLSELRNNLREVEIDVYIPKFTFETKYFLPDTLSEMGMPTAFTWPDADFSGMDGTKYLFIQNVIHQAFVEVNEEGTEAAAATAVIVGFGAAMNKVFRADHPFIFIIQERETGNILFLGRVTDPTS